MFKKNFREAYDTNQGLGGTEENQFWSLWPNIKMRIAQIYGVGPQILQQQAVLHDLWVRAINAGDKATANQLQAVITANIDKQITYAKIKDYIDAWMPKWMQMENEASSTQPTDVPSSMDHPLSMSMNGFGSIIKKQQGMGDLGFLFLPAWALASLIGGGLVALVYVSTYGLQLLKDYENNQSLIVAVQSKVLTAEQAATLAKGMQPQPGTTAMSAFGGQAGKYIGIGAAILGAIWLLPKLIAGRKKT